MDKSLYTKEYRLLLDRLRALREGADITQIELAKRLEATQSFVSKCERGERRLDVVELRTWCQAIGEPFPQFVAEIDDLLKGAGRARGRR